MVAERVSMHLERAWDGDCSVNDPQVMDLTVLVPAYNEAESITDTVQSLLDQSTRPRRIIVVDDCSTDGTGDLARSLGVDVLRLPTNSGSKAGAQTFALRQVDSAFVMAIDADTVLEVDAIETLACAFDSDAVAAASGFVIPRYVSSVWERGRYIEYLYSFSFHKQVQDHYSRPLIASGCFSIYRTDLLRQVGGWSNRTMAEDMDLTWSFYEQGYQVRFVPSAACYPIEPQDLHFLAKQLRRWSHGFIQNVRLHWRGLLGQRYLRSTVSHRLLRRRRGAAGDPDSAAPVRDSGQSLVLPGLRRRPAGHRRTRTRGSVAPGRTGQGVGEPAGLLPPPPRELLVHAASGRRGARARPPVERLREGPLT